MYIFWPSIVLRAGDAFLRVLCWATFLPGEQFFYSFSLHATCFHCKFRLYSVAKMYVEMDYTEEFQASAYCLLISCCFVNCLLAGVSLGFVFINAYERSVRMLCVLQRLCWTLALIENPEKIILRRFPASKNRVVFDLVSMTNFPVNLPRCWKRCSFDIFNEFS